jgi:hypothetical protein
MLSSDGGGVRVAGLNRARVLSGLSTAVIRHHVF